MDPIPFPAANSTAFRWLRTREDPLEFDLLAEDRPLATLVWKSGGRSVTTARTADGSWTLKRGGFLNPQVTIRPVGKEQNAARISVHLNYHRIDVTGGPSYRFHRAGVLLPAWQVSTDAGEEVLHIEPVREGRKLVGGAVVTNADAVKRPELPILVVISWYFIVLAWFEDEALVPLEGQDAAPTPAAPG
jgi:hypothetical protein